MKRALVTGGAGFIGSNVVDYLIKKRIKVRVYDNLSSGYLKNIEDKDIEFIHDDILNQDALFKACKGIDAVFHLAASVGRQRSIDHPQLDSEVNILGTINLLEGMRKHSVRKIIYSSSAAIFGELATDTIREDHPQNADSPYGVSKLAAEKMIMTYGNVYGIIGICLRYFNIYGVNQRYDVYGNVIPIFAHKIFNNEPLTIYGDGEQTRDFVNVKDVAVANYISAIKCSKTALFNLGSGSSISINNLAKRMLEISGRVVDIKYEPERTADVKHCKADNHLVKQAIGFIPKIQLDEGLSEYIQWYKNNEVRK
ncbi:MAG TPA: NAD-dependent epimerase/dehydratase family protein [Ignavibacteria bacterium]|nr:NAD-dependent epimerase/dehydratase family protein [Ignavibacteria bacterium]